MARARRGRKRPLMPTVSLNFQRAVARAPFSFSRLRRGPAAPRSVAAMATKDPLCGDVFFLDEVGIAPLQCLFFANLSYY